MTRKELEDTEIVTGCFSAYIAKKSKSDSLISDVRRKITDSEILGLIAWYSEKKFEKDNCTEYPVTLNGKVILTIRKGGDE